MPRAERPPATAPKRERSLTLSFLACVVAAVALTAVGYALARVFAGFFVS